MKISVSRTSRNVTMTRRLIVWLVGGTPNGRPFGVPVGVPTTIFLLSHATLPKPPVWKGQAMDSRALLLSPLPWKKNGVPSRLVGFVVP
jgi:hypothetical protein